MPDVTFCDGPYACAEGAEALVIVTEWEQFRALDFDRLKRLMACPSLSICATSMPARTWVGTASCMWGSETRGPSDAKKL